MSLVDETSKNATGNQKRLPRGFSGSTLKLIAITAILIDHIGAALLAKMVTDNAYAMLRNQSIIWLPGNEVLSPLYTLMRSIGRIAFPIFIFLMIEGLKKTRNVRKYIFRMGCFALLSEIPFDLAFNGHVLEFGYQNVYFTLCIGLIVIASIQWMKEKLDNPIAKILTGSIIVIVGAFLAEAMSTDYGAIGVVCIAIMYIFSNDKSTMLLAGATSFCWELPAPLAFIPIAFYNGKRGLKLKYLFYVFYPLHLLLLYFVGKILGIL